MSHKSSELEFDYGVNVIVGPNGAGKTSILDAISFALFNVHSRGKNENLVHRNAERSRVFVEFSEGGVKYAVDWDVDRRGKQVKGILLKVEDGRRLIIARGGGRTIISEIEKITGLDEHLFLHSVYVQQGEIERLVTETPSNRKQIISRLLGIEDLEKAYQYMREVIGEYQNIASYLDGELKRKPDVEGRIRSLKSEIDSLESSLRSESLKLKDVEEEISALERQLKELDRKKEIFAELSSRAAVLETKIADLARSLRQKEADLKEAEAAFVKVEGLRDAVARLPIMEKYCRLLQALVEKEREMDLEHQKLKRIEELNSILTRNVRAYESYLAKSAALSQKMLERRGYEGSREGLMRLERMYEETLKERNRRFDALTRLLDECSRVLGERVSPENLHSLLDKRRRELNALRSSLEGKASIIKEEIGSIKSRIEDLEFKLSKISESDICPICKRTLSPEHKLRLMEEFDKVRQDSYRDMASLQHDLKQIESEKKICEENLEKLSKIDPDRISEILSEIGELDKKAQQYRHEMEILRKRVEVLNKLDSEITALEEEIKSLEEAYREYDAARRELSRWPLKEEIEANLDRINKEIEALSNEAEDLLNSLGYRPSDPEKELFDLRVKKAEYDRNEPLARKLEALRVEVQSLTSEILAESEELEGIKALIKELAYDESLHRMVQQGYEKKISEKIRLVEKISALRAELERARMDKEKSEKEMSQLLEKEREKAKVEEFIKTLKIIRDAFHKDGVQRLIRARSRPLLEKFTRDFLEKFNLEISDVHIDDDYNILVTGPAGLQSIEQISGGERVALSISLRLAIARVLSDKVEAIIMDEPTIHLDEERRKDLINVLSSFFREGGRIIPQIIVITHHHEIEEAADVMYSVSKREGVSVVELERS
ncbi:MAG: AAA family ATPase [Candidatus Bathyarchaeota archaeon]|nr:AAA family ATPase [Candidatus Bathyarchaeota archaeon]